NVAAELAEPGSALDQTTVVLTAPRINTPFVKELLGMQAHVQAGKKPGLCLRLIGSVGMPSCGMDLWECDMPASHCQATLGYALDHSIAPGALEAFASTEQI
ncbi:unnamed protein product, partial [Effrenium voratum]